MLILCFLSYEKYVHKEMCPITNCLPDVNMSNLYSFGAGCFSFVKGRDYDPDRERAEMKKLKKQLKREAKGAARELRKDNYFIADVKANEKAVAQQERDEKYRKAMSFLEQQESAFKSGQLGKGKKRKKR